MTQQNLNIRFPNMLVLSKSCVTPGETCPLFVFRYETRGVSHPSAAAGVAVGGRPSVLAADEAAGLCCTGCSLCFLLPVT